MKDVLGFVAFFGGLFLFLGCLITAAEEGCWEADGKVFIQEMNVERSNLHGDEYMLTLNVEGTQYLYNFIPSWTKERELILEVNEEFYNTVTINQRLSYEDMMRAVSPTDLHSSWDYLRDM